MLLGKPSLDASVCDAFVTIFISFGSVSRSNIIANMIDNYYFGSPRFAGRPLDFYGEQFSCDFANSTNCEQKWNLFIHLVLLVAFLPIFVQITLLCSGKRFRYVPLEV